MSNSTVTFDAIAQSQASKEVTANAYFDAASPATLFGRRQSTTSGLTWGYYGGNVTKSDGTQTTIANGTLSLTPSTTNYVVAQKSDGVVSVSTATTNWNDTANYWRLYSVVAGASTITSYTDEREIGRMTGLGTGLVFGVSQQLRGAHFLSHDVATALICWLLSLSLYLIVKRVLARRQLDRPHRQEANA